MPPGRPRAELLAGLTRTDHQVTAQSAYELAPVSAGYFRGLPLQVSRLRADPLLAQARDTGDPLSLARLFGLSDDAAVRYCTELDPTEAPTDRR